MYRTECSPASDKRSDGTGHVAGEFIIGDTFGGATRVPGKNVGGAKEDERGARDSHAEKNSIPGDVNYVEL